jgi:hypothetical protein
MTSELIEDIEDKRGTAIMLSMRATGHAVLTLMDKTDEIQMIDFHLDPNANGLELSKKIEQGLIAWREQVVYLQNQRVTESQK